MKDFGQIKTDCRKFRGDIPCVPHKKHGVHCKNCGYYQPIEERILIIKLGAVGDVVRTTPILHKLKEVYPNSEITWLSRYPNVLPDIVDKALSIRPEMIAYLLADEFDLLLNFDKDTEVVALTKMINAKVKKGFTFKKGKCAPIDNAAYNKWLTGLSDDVNRANIKSYPEEVFEICGFSFSGEEYIFDAENFNENIECKRPIVGLNTGCGSRWITRQWSINNWVNLARLLKQSGLGVLLLGGESEDMQNKFIAEQAGVLYLGYFPIIKFSSLVKEVDLVVTLVTFALHVAIGLKRKVVLLNNIFNKNELKEFGFVYEAIGKG